MPLSLDGDSSSASSAVGYRFGEVSLPVWSQSVSLVTMTWSGTVTVQLLAKKSCSRSVACNNAGGPLLPMTYNHSGIPVTWMRMQSLGQPLLVDLASW